MRRKHPHQHASRRDLAGDRRDSKGMQTFSAVVRGNGMRATGWRQKKRGGQKHQNRAGAPAAQGWRCWLAVLAHCPGSTACRTDQHGHECDAPHRERPPPPGPCPARRPATTPALAAWGGAAHHFSAATSSSTSSSVGVRLIRRPISKPHSNSRHMGMASMDCENGSGGVSSMPKMKQKTIT